MELTKENCNDALTRLLRPYFARVDVQNVYHSINPKNSIDEDSNRLTLLIMEHFELLEKYEKLKKELENKPLKFEELKYYMWVWDNLYKEWIQCRPGINRKGNSCIKYLSDGNECNEYFVEFEDGRFFRKEVE